MLQECGLNTDPVSRQPFRLFLLWSPRHCGSLRKVDEDEIAAATNFPRNILVLCQIGRFRCPI